MDITNDNYFSKEVEMEYCSNSQYKSFFGSAGIPGCQSRALAELKGEYKRPSSDALLLGSYVDCALTEPDFLEMFKADHPEMISSRGESKGQLKAAFRNGDIMVNRIKKEPLLMKMLSGEHQKIMTGEIYGVPFRIKMDSYLPDKAIVDLKTTSNMRKDMYSVRDKKHMNFLEFFSYDLQGAIYQEIVYQNTGKRLPFYIVAVENSEHPLCKAYQIDQYSMDTALQNVENNVRLLPRIKSGEIEPEPCGECDYCADTIPVVEIEDWLQREDTGDTD